MFKIWVYAGESASSGWGCGWTHAWNAWVMNPAAHAMRLLASVDAAPEEYG